MRVLFLVAVFLLSACGGDGSAPPSDPAPTSIIRDIRCEADVLSGAPYGGFFSGEIVGAEGSGWATALLTEDGYFRLHIEDSLGDGAPEFQFIGRYRAQGERNNTWAWGEFRLQNCSDADAFCFASEGQFELTSLCAGELTGTLVAYPEGRPFPPGWEILSFTLDPPVPSAYDTPATLAFSEGVYDGSYPYYASAGPSDITATVDAAGAMFFQSAATGCVGNGTLSPHLDGTYNVYDVEVTIANCADASSHLNGVFTGLATRPLNPDEAFPVDALLMWLSTPATLFEQGADPAMTLMLDRL